MSMPSGFRPSCNNKPYALVPGDTGGEGTGRKVVPHTHLVWRLLEHGCLPVPVQFALPVTRLAGTGIQKMLLPVLQMRAGGKVRFSAWRKEICQEAEAGL